MIIKSFEKSKFFSGPLYIEMYRNAIDMARDLETRKIMDARFESDPYKNPSWTGADREQTYKMLREGYQPVVDALKAETKFSVSGQGKRFTSYNDVAGYQPIIPNAIMGLPNSMINSRIKPIKTKVIDLFYEMTIMSYHKSDDLIQAGQKILGAILELEAQGYRFNLYCTQGYYSHGEGCDMLCVKVKSANQPMDLKRMSFPIAHTAFFRGLGFDWYSKFPKGRYRAGYGIAISTEKTQEEISEEYRNIFGGNAVYFSAISIIKKGNDAKKYLMEVLTNG